MISENLAWFTGKNSEKSSTMAISCTECIDFSLPLTFFYFRLLLSLISTPPINALPEDADFK